MALIWIKSHGDTYLVCVEVESLSCKIDRLAVSGSSYCPEKTAHHNTPPMRATTNSDKGRSRYRISIFAALNPYAAMCDDDALWCGRLYWGTGNRYKRHAFRMTAIEDININNAASHGVTKPAAAKGIVNTCHPRDPKRFCLAIVRVRSKSNA